VGSDLDRQTEFEREFMDNEAYGDDWYIKDEILESVGIVEYQMYLMDCVEVGMEDATKV
jgi:hypothetical protein